jgi:GWxTD domain-containing protein
MRKQRRLTTVMIDNTLNPITSTPMLVSAVTRLSRRFPFVSLVLLLLSLTLPGFCSSTKLPPKYSEWLKKDVVYIISNEERDTFRNLASDEARERFIEHFWEIRNPNPGAPTNTYREEHYQRLQYASDHFGKFGDGWRTDMGRIYITLGPPAQKARYVAQSGVRGMEIWFYQNTHPALPPFFNIVFYEKDFGDFRLYSPYMDGPQKLVTGIQAEQGRTQSYLQIDHILGREVAHTTLTLLPDEPVNPSDANSTMLSDLMLGTIHDLANNPFTVAELKLKRSLNEDVTHRVILPGDLLNVVTVPLRDARGQIRLHYALRLPKPEDFAVAQSDKGFYYSVEALVRVQDESGKEIYNLRRKMAKYLTKDELESVKGKPVAYEGWVPLTPGKFKIGFLFTNLLTKTAFTADRTVTVPDVVGQDFFVGEPIPFGQASAPDPSLAEFAPFTAGGVRFDPYITGRALALVPGQELKFFYQIWRPEGSVAGSGSKLSVDYAYGRPSYSGSTQSIHEEVASDQFDGHGSMVSGKKIDTIPLGVGDYRLAITVFDPATQQKRFSAFTFKIVSDDPSPSDIWRLEDEELKDYVTSGQSDLDRGLAYLSQGKTQPAADSFLQALHYNPANERARTRLSEYYFQQQQYAKVVELYARNEITPETDEGTILHVAASLNKTGQSAKAVSFLESALKVKDPSGPLYLALSDSYQHAGNRSQAEAFERKGRALMTVPPVDSER